ncbi:unnamed protein product, partial [Mesorhabditis spiculigera]
MFLGKDNGGDENYPAFNNRALTGSKKRKDKRDSRDTDELMFGDSDPDEISIVDITMPSTSARKNGLKPIVLTDSSVSKPEKSKLFGRPVQRDSKFSNAFDSAFNNDPMVELTKRKMLHVLDPAGLRHKQLEESVENSVRQTIFSAHPAKRAKSKFTAPSFAKPGDFKTASGASRMGKEVHKVVTPAESPENQPTPSNSQDKGDRYLGNKLVFSLDVIILFRKLGGSTTGSSGFVPPTGIAKQAAEAVLKTTIEEPTGLRAEPSLKMFDENIIRLIENEIMAITRDTDWRDVAGLEAAKKALSEIVVLPFKRPDVFTGIRAPPKGVLLFGPPGTGKTMIGRCVASQCKATFFNISASSLTSKWVGEGEKLVRALFAVARLKDPSIIFIDEIDSLLCARSETEHESSRRIKTEFLVQLDGVATSAEDRLLVLGATNRPQELDEAARRRFAKRLYVPLPQECARRQMVHNLIAQNTHRLRDKDLDEIAGMTKGYSGADMRNLCSEAAMGPVRDIVNNSEYDIETIPLEKNYHEWDKKFGCLPKNYIEDEATE